MEDRLIITWDEFTLDCRVLAHEIRKSNIEVPGIVAIARGGLVVAGILAELLDVRQVESLCLQSYSEEGERGEIVQRNELDVERYCAGFLVVDDLVDSGHTINHTNNLGLLNSAVLYRKDKTLFEPTVFVRAIPAEKWIVFPWE